MSGPDISAGAEGRPPRAERIGFVGLGRMGFPMAANLARRGFRLTVFDKRAEAARQCAESCGAEAAGDLAALGGADIVLLMLPSSQVVAEVLAGTAAERGLAESLAPGALVIDCSTSDPLATRRLGADLAARGIGMVDAPVAGGVVFAEDGSLDVLAGGAPADLDRAEPILLSLGRSVHRCGPLGSAHAMKLLNNFVNAQALLTYSEAMALGAKLGLDLDVMVGALLAATTGRNHPFEKKIVRQVLTGAFASGMSLGLISKDVSLAREMAGGLDAWSPVLERAAALWEEARRTLGPDADQTEAVRLWESRLGVALRSGDPAS